MKSIKYLLLLILCAGLIDGAANVSAQTGGDRALTTDKKPLRQSEVQYLIDLYEWTFETKFTDDERKKFQVYTINEYSNDPIGSRATIEDVVKTLPGILASDNDLQSAIRTEFLKKFLENVGKGAGENSRMLVEIYERGRNIRQNSGADNANRKEAAASGNRANTSANNRSGNTGSLSGKWFRSTGSGSRDYTGKTQYKSGEDFTFEFFPDGTVSYTSKLDILSIMQCTIKGENKASGTYTISGDSLTINLGAMSSVKTNSCDRKENYNKTLEPTSKTIKFEVRKMESITRPDNPTMLCFEGASDNDCYERVK
jgi:hypothetical protein